MGNRSAIVHSDPSRNDAPITQVNPLPVSSIACFVTEQFDGVYATYPTGTTEVYTYKLGVVTVAVLTLTYSDSTKEVLVSSVKT